MIKLLYSNGSFLWHLKYVAQQFMGNVVNTDIAIMNNGTGDKNLCPILIPNGIILNSCIAIIIKVKNNTQVVPIANIWYNVLLNKLSSEPYSFLAMSPLSIGTFVLIQLRVSA